MKRRNIKHSGSSKQPKRPKFVIGKPGSRSRSLSTISRSSKHSGSPKGSRKYSRESLLSGRATEVSTDSLQLPTPRIGDPQQRQILKSKPKIKKTQRIHDRSQQGLALCCHWNHCPHHKPILEQHLSNPEDDLTPIHVYHGKACDGKECLGFMLPAKFQPGNKLPGSIKAEEETKQALKQTAATQTCSQEVHDRMQVDVAKKTLDTSQAPVISGEKSPSCQTPIKPLRKRPPQPCLAPKELDTLEVDISKMNYGTSQASSSHKSPHHQKPLKPKGNQAPQPRTQKSLHVVKVDVHHDKPIDPEQKPAPQTPRTQKDLDKKKVDTSRVTHGTSKTPKIRFAGNPGFSQIPLPVRPIEEQKQAPQQPPTQEARKKIKGYYDCPPSTSRSTPIVKHKSSNSNKMLAKPTKPEQNPAPEKEDDVSESESWVKLSWAWSTETFSSIKGWLQGKKKMTVLAEGADSSAPPLKKIRLCQPPGEPVLTSYRSMATPIDAVAPEKPDIPQNPPSAPVPGSSQLRRQSQNPPSAPVPGSSQLQRQSQNPPSAPVPGSSQLQRQSQNPPSAPVPESPQLQRQLQNPPSTPEPESPQLERPSIPFYKTSEFQLMWAMQEKFNLQEQRRRESLKSANSLETLCSDLILALPEGDGSSTLILALPERDRSSVMLNGYGGLVDTHKAHSPDDSSPNTEGASPVATLCNLGNTCFLNSVLYTLRFAPNFLHNLHHLSSDLVEFNGKYSHLKTKSSSLGRGIGGGSKSWSNKDLSTMGQGTTQEDKIALATLRLHELYEALHNAELKDHIEPYQPEIFLTALREVNSIFEGNQQHDAHELLVCLLDTIRETCRQLSQLNERQRCIIPQPPPPTCPLPPAKSSFSSNVRKSLKLGKTKSNSVLDKKNTSSATKLGKILVPCDIMTGSPKADDPASEPQSCPDVISTSEPDPEKSLPQPSFLHLSESIKKKMKARGSSKTSVAGEPQHSEGPLICDQALSQNEEEGPRVGHNFISEDFEGLMHLYTTCLECEKINTRPETFIDICVPVTPPSGSCVTAEEISALYHSAIVTEEYLQDANKYWCEYCGRYNEARRNVSFDSLPRLLILQLKRFSSSFGSCVQKLNEFMPTPILLSCFCKKCKDLDELRKPHRGYQLYGIIMHLGSTMASGHYVTYVCGRDTVTDCTNCTRDKRKTASLSGGAGKPTANPAVEKHGLFRFFKSSKPSYPSALDSRSAYYPPCRSADCCGVKLESNEPVWLECDDDTVRTISRKQLEELLGPKTPKNAALTPYLLFYSRIQ